MDTIHLISPPLQFFRFFLELALSFLVSVVNANHREKFIERRSYNEFDINTETGFFPPHPLPRLPETFEIWEQALTEANNGLILGEDSRDEVISKRSFGEAWRSGIRTWPVLDTRVLQLDHRLLQRAHLVLAWLVNFYVHSQPSSDDNGPILVPKALAVPLVAVSRCLDIAPVLTFADTVLWNWEPLDQDRPISMDNIKFTNLFSGTEDERSFYLSCAKAEWHGVEALRIIEDYNNLPYFIGWASISKVSRGLARLAMIIDDIKDDIKSVRPTCDPHVFYWAIRPWFRGSDAKGPDGSKWVYEGIDDSNKLDLSGASAGQSSIMHALDLFLDIDHTLQQKRLPMPSNANKKADHSFMERMRRYMPGKHREYLDYIAATPRSVRKLAQTVPALQEPYDAVVLALKRLRDEHIKIASLYVVTMSRSTSPYREYPMSATTARLETSRGLGKGPVRGTGGNELSVLLKAGRDATRRAMLKSG